MGCSPSAEIFWGYDLGDGNPFYNETLGEDEELDTDCWVEILAVERGGINPWRDFYRQTAGMDYRAREAAYDEWKTENEEAIEAWRLLKQQVEEETPVVIGFYGADGWNCHYLALKRTVVDTLWSCDRFSDDQLAILAGVRDPIPQEEQDALQAFIERFGIEVEGEPGWHIACQYW